MATTAGHTEINSTVSALSDDQLLEQAGKLAGLDHQIHVFVIDHLLEIEARRVYLSRGFSSLFDYVKRGLGYSDAATWRRINAMKLCTRIDGVRERLWDGSLTLDAAAQLQAAFERRDRERGRGAGAGTGSAMGSNGSARPAPEPKPGPVLDVSAQKALVEQAAGKSTREVTKMLADVDPARGAGGSAATAGRGALGAQGGHRRGLPPRAGAAQRAALPRRSAHDARAARGAAGQRRPRPPRSGPSPAPRTHPQRSRGCRPTFGELRSRRRAQHRARVARIPHTAAVERRR